MAAKSTKVWLKVLQYLVSLAVAIALLYWAFQDISLTDMWGRLSEVDWSLILLSLVLGLGSHVARAYRWNLLFGPLGFKPHLGTTFLAVMIAYLGNLAVPRLGEVARCAFLQRKAGVPLVSGFGTVVTERLSDLLVLLLLIGAVLVLEFSTLYQFFQEQFFSAPSQEDSEGSGLMIYISVAGVVLVLAALWLWRGGWAKLQQLALYKRLEPLVRKFGEGLLSFRKLERPAHFWISTLLIWVLYLGMAYTVVLAFPPTEDLSWINSLTILVVGGLGMAAPVQGGIGAYHLLISGLLLIYGVGELDGITFATLMHTSQTFLVLVVGAVALVIGLFIPRYEAPTHPTED